jgi:peptidoglycan hydrolase CwlO-like protein
MAKTLNDAKAKYTKYERQDIQISEDKKHITKQIDKLKKTITQTEKTISTKQKLIKESTSEIKEWNSKASNLVEPLKKEEKLLEKMFEGIKGMLFHLVRLLVRNTARSPVRNTCTLD